MVSARPGTGSRTSTTRSAGASPGPASPASASRVRARRHVRDAPLDRSAHDLVFVYLTGVWGLPTQPIDAVQNAVYAAVR